MNKTLKNEASWKRSVRVEAICKEVRERAATSSFHAIPNIVKSKQVAVKVFYSVSFIISSICCSFLLSEAFDSYYNR